MSKGLFLVSALGLGAAAVYLFDEKQGKKRRKRLQSQVSEAACVASDLAGDCYRAFGKRAEKLSREYGPVLQDYSRKFGARAQEYGKELGTRANEIAVNGNSHWAPSARMAGALASALAFYGAGRRGIGGTLLRTLSLGMFTKALMASR